MKFINNNSSSQVNGKSVSFGVVPRLHILIAVLCTLNVSCNKIVTVTPPIDQITSKAVFSSDKSAVASIDGLYSQIMGTNLTIANGGVSIYCGLSADDIFNTTPRSDLDPFRINLIPVTNAAIETFWSSSYTNIYQANAIIEGLSASNVTDSLKSQLLGEAKFIRALYYFYLSNLYGDVPLITTTDYHLNANMGRTPIAQINSQIETDLKDAVTLMAINYPSPEKVRPNKMAAAALLARLYLYEKNWALSAAQCDVVINSGIYSIEPDLNSVFVANDQEAILQLMPVNNIFNTTEGFYFIPNPGIIPTYAVDSVLLKAFEPNDQRKINWLNSAIVNGQTYYYPFKYKVGNSSTVTEYNVVLRLSELYLIRAEARANLNDVGGAQNDLNVIRNRAGLGNTSASDQPSLTDSILHERQTELFCEWGNRWLDLKRLGLSDAVLGSEKLTWKSTAVKYPIPLVEITANQALNQNAGY